MAVSALNTSSGDGKQKPKPGEERSLDSPRAFMYSSKFSLSTSFQVAQKASTMMKLREAEGSPESTERAAASTSAVILPLILCTQVGGARRPIGSGDFI